MEITKQFTEDFFQLLALKNVYVTSHFVTLRTATSGDKRLQNGLFSEAVSCPKLDNIDLGMSPLRIRILESQKYILMFKVCKFFGKVRRVNFL